MTRTLIYFFPMAVSVMQGTILFLCPVRAADAGLSVTGVASMLTMAAAGYMLISPIVGRLTRRSNVGWLMIGSCLSLAAFSVVFVLFPSIKASYLLITLSAVAAAFFFTPLQVFMKYVDLGTANSVAHSAVLYTFSWSLGLGGGAFVSGLIWEAVGWEMCYLVSGGIAALTAIAICAFKHYADVGSGQAPLPGRGKTPTEEREVDYSPLPNLAWMAWLCGGIGCLTVTTIRGIFPSSGAVWQLSKFEQGLVFFILSSVQALVALSLRRSRIWMYRPLPVVASSSFGVLGLCLFAFAQEAHTFFLAAACFGVYSGSFYFYFVFHSLIHPEAEARNISINEAVVGLTGIIGPLAAGLVADRFGLHVAYLMLAGLVAVAIVIQGAVHGRHAGQVRICSK